MSFPAPHIQFYKRVLPNCCTAFSSDSGKKLFQESLSSGYASIYFVLAEQFTTQAEPAYCGLTNLVMTLNALQVDPKRVWKGPWRWYHEEMLDCCYSLDVIQQQGITMDQFANLAICNNLDLSMVRVTDHEKEEDFRDVVKQICSGEGRILVCSYSRKGFKQTGDGHFTCIGAYHVQEDKVLIMDTARFKYPPHWVDLKLLWTSMAMKDQKTGLSRGYFQLGRSEAFPLLLFRLSRTFRVTISSQSPIFIRMSKFIKTWQQSIINNIQACLKPCPDIFHHMIEPLNVALETLTDGESFFTTQFDTCCFEVLPEEYSKSVLELLRAIEDTKLYEITTNAVKEFYRKTQPRDVQDIEEQQEGCRKQCKSATTSCGLDKIGKSAKKSTGTDKTNEIELQDSEKITTKKKKCNKMKCKKRQGDGNSLVGESHYITMLFLSWPYPTSDREHCIARFVQETMCNTAGSLDNEVRCLRQQIVLLLSMFMCGSK